MQDRMHNLLHARMGPDFPAQPKPTERMPQISVALEYPLETRVYYISGFYWTVIFWFEERHGKGLVLLVDTQKRTTTGFEQRHCITATETILEADAIDCY
eukprot:TRINITY_DN5717_c0_g1_i1.p3 TRINITY_DN5717_c0_g1~~TRINITY_DN5717_c0_g1_i1.p3  ORF type:complete len:100 (-),score=24.95 TRINITY_DN5717_c0_g1_i1:48-347(-)